MWQALIEHGLDAPKTITWSNDNLLSIGPLGTEFSEFESKYNHFIQQNAL